MLREATLGFRSPSRNLELLLLTASAAFLLVGWRALDAAAVPLPEGSARILAQFLATATAGHLGLRALAPRASPLPYACALLLSAIGLVFVARIAPDVARTQTNWVTLGVAVMLPAAFLGRRYALLRTYTYSAALLAVVILILTGLFGTTINGARLWIRIAGQEVQTTEFIKLLLILFLAGYLSREAAVLSLPRLRFGGRTYTSFPYLLPLLGVLAAALGAMALLRELGSIAILLLLSAAVLYVATGRVRFLLAGAGLVLLTAAFGYLAFDYARARVDVWLDPFSTASTSGYQAVQGMFALQAGGVTGTGVGLGDPRLIPAATTDYIFTAIGEELGLAGALGVVFLFAVLLFAGLRIALDARDSYGRLLAASIALLFVIQATVIIGGNLRLIPTTGVTLPFVSYGGSSLIVNFALVGLLLGVSEAAARQGQG